MLGIGVGLGDVPIYDPHGGGAGVGDIGFLIWGNDPMIWGGQNISWL